MNVDKLRSEIALDMMALRDLNVLCRTRIVAIEKVILGSRWALIRSIFMLIFSPASLAEKINHEHEEALGYHEDQMKKISQAVETHAPITILKNG